MMSERPHKVITIRTRLGDDRCTQQYVKKSATWGQSETVSTVTSTWAARALRSLEIILVYCQKQYIRSKNMKLRKDRHLGRWSYGSSKKHCHFRRFAVQWYQTGRK